MVNLANIFPMLLLPLTLLVGGFAIWKGRSAERLGGVALIGTLCLQIILTLLARPLGYSIRAMAGPLDVAMSLILGLVFLWAALKHHSRWLGFAFIVQGAELTVSAYFLGPDTLISPILYFRLLNLMTMATVSLLAIATVQSVVIRRRERRARAQAA